MIRNVAPDHVLAHSVTTLVSTILVMEFGSLEVFNEAIAVLWETLIPGPCWFCPDPHLGNGVLEKRETALSFLGGDSNGDFCVD